VDEALARWLTLREQADFASRSEPLTQLVVESLPKGGLVRALDLATGRGSNIRYLMDWLPRPQQWLAVDRSEILLSHLRARMSESPPADVQIETRQANLGTLDDAGLFAGRHLVTASALLDLVSADWLRALARQCRAAGASVLFTITYNGGTSSTPSEPEDGLVLELFNRHQRTDKGLGGVAAGPDASAAAERAFADAGYAVRREPSDWILGPERRDMQRLLIEGWAQAASEMAPERAQEIGGWLARRLAHVEAGRSHITVGHDDLAAIPHR
jgi:hypothetical protein